MQIVLFLLFIVDGIVRERKVKGVHLDVAILLKTCRSLNLSSLSEAGGSRLCLLTSEAV
jgi:hypothetical protein